MVSKFENFTKIMKMENVIDLRLHLIAFYVFIIRKKGLKKK